MYSSYMYSYILLRRAALPDPSILESASRNANRPLPEKPKTQIPDVAVVRPVKPEIKERAMNNETYDSQSEQNAACTSVKIAKGGSVRVSTLQPHDIQKLSIRDVGDCLVELGLEKYAKLFAEKLVDGALLIDLDKDDFMGEDFKMTSFEAKKLDGFVKKCWKPKK